MSKENRFEGLMGVVGKNKNVQTSKRSSSQKSKSPKKSDPKSDNSTSKNSNFEVSKNLDIQTSTIQVDSSQNIQTSEQLNGSPSKSSNVQTSKKAKSVNPDYTRTTLYLPKTMHKKLKAIAVDEEREMSSIVEDLIETWINSRS